MLAKDAVLDLPFHFQGPLESRSTNLSIDSDGLNQYLNA